MCTIMHRKSSTQRAGKSNHGCYSVAMPSTQFKASLIIQHQSRPADIVHNAGRALLRQLLKFKMRKRTLASKKASIQNSGPSCYLIHSRDCEGSDQCGKTSLSTVRSKLIPQRKRGQNIDLANFFPS